MARSFSRNQLPVRAASSLSLVRISKGRWKRRLQLVLPLLDQAAGADDEAALEVAAGDQLLDEEAGHDGLARAGVVREQEAQRLARQHRLVDRGDLVRQRLDQRGVDREHRVEQVRQADAVRLGDQAEERPVAVEAPGTTGGHDLQHGLVVPIEQLVADPAAGVLVGELHGVRAEPLHADHRHQPVGQDAAHDGIRLEGFEGGGHGIACCGCRFLEL